MSFKICGKCSTIWEDREEFLINGNTKLIGYQASFDDPYEGLFLFNHMIEDCGSTVAIEVNDFADLYRGEKYTEAKRGLAECGGHCKSINDLERCQAMCKFAFVREIIIVIKNLQVPHNEPVIK